MVEKIHLSMGDMVITTKFTEDFWEKGIVILLQSVTWDLRSTTM